ncbi:MAG: Gldg family protein [Arenicellales bacterium]|nr:Gldg family protein [Arenicellales bacterium]
MRTGKHYLTWGGLTLGMALLFAINLFSNTAFTSSRVDLTENRLYTLTTGTKNILGALEEPITLRLFLSQKQATRLPGISNYTQRVKGLLREYERQAGGNIKLHIIDPEPFSEEEDRAVGYGVRGVVVDEQGTQFYFGLAGANSTDDEEVIPFFALDREELLEHDLTRLIYQLSNTKTTTVGLLSSLPLDGGMPSPQALGQGMPRPWVVLEQMRQLFTVTTIEPDSRLIPEDIDVLMVVHPKQLPPSTLYAIDQYVLRGGRALIFVDPNAEVDRAAGMMGMGAPPGSSDLKPLFDAWGLGLVEEKVAGDLSVAQRVRYGQQQSQGVIDYPIWMDLPVEQNNPDDVVTSRLGNLVFASPGILTDLEKEGANITPLVWTTENAMQYDVAQLRFLMDPTVLLQGYVPGGQSLNLAVRVSGQVETAFKEGPPPEEPEQPEQDSEQDSEQEEEQADAAEPNEPLPPHLETSSEDINLIVVADADMLHDEFWVTTQNFLGTRLSIPTAANGNFVINSLENLLGSNDLISVRSRGQFSRPFTRVAQIQQAAEIKFRQKEQELLTSLQETENKLIELEKGGQDQQPLILSPEQEEEIEKFREEKVRIRKELRMVRHQLHEDIQRLESVTKFINIGFMPLVVGIGGVLISLNQSRRRKRKSKESTNAD